MNVRDLSVSTRLTLAFGLVIAVFLVALALAAAQLVGFNNELMRDSSTLLLVLASVAAAIGCAVAYLATGSITKPLRQALDVLEQIGKGNYDTTVATSSHDETGKVIAALEAMQLRLKTRMEDERAQAVESGRIRVALDRVSASVMVADVDGKIVYMNDSTLAMMRKRSADIRMLLPQFDPERLVGSSFDAFHRTPSHQRNLLANLTGPHTVDTKLGMASLRITANPVVDKDGQRLGTVVQWLDRTQEVATQVEVQTTVARAIKGDLTVRIPQEDKDGFFKILAGGVNDLINNMADVIRTLSTAAAEVRSGAGEISRGNADLSERTEEQASSLQQTSSSMEQMTATVKNNADNAAQANQLALAARSVAERGGAVMSSAVAAMSGINASSKKIADIIGVIDDIAFQTNLLALNAAVEAARAGEQGRGFAVVATEVRNLASRSASAAKEIKELIGDSVDKVTEGTRLVDESGRLLAEIVTGVKKVTDVMAEMAASSQEQAAGIEQVNKAVVSMDAMTQQNAALVEEASAAAQALTNQSEALTDLMARYQVGDTATTEAPQHPVDNPAPAAAQDRRASRRPWSRKGKAVAEPAPDRKAAAGGDWSEF